MNDTIKGKLSSYYGKKVELKTKNGQKFEGIISWLSPDSYMVEVQLKKGEVKTFLCTDIKSISLI